MYLKFTESQFTKLKNQVIKELDEVISNVPNMTYEFIELNEKNIRFKYNYKVTAFTNNNNYKLLFNIFKDDINYQTADEFNQAFSDFLNKTDRNETFPEVNAIRGKIRTFAHDLLKENNDPNDIDYFITYHLSLKKRELDYSPVFSKLYQQIQDYRQSSELYKEIVEEDKQSRIKQHKSCSLNFNLSDVDYDYNGPEHIKYQVKNFVLEAVREGEGFVPGDFRLYAKKFARFIKDIHNCNVNIDDICIGIYGVIINLTFDKPLSENDLNEINNLFCDENRVEICRELTFDYDAWSYNILTEEIYSIEIFV